MNRARALVKKCQEEVKNILALEEKSHFDARQWAEMLAFDKKKQALSEMSLEGFDMLVSGSKNEVGKCLRAFTEQMVALVPGHHVEVQKEIESWVEAEW